MHKASKAWEEALVAGLDYVLSCQSIEGSWKDWKLPPGESRAWTTAFVGYKLGKLPSRFKSRSISARRAASEWLIRSIFPDGGWGYNEVVESDADSTAYAILFLCSERKSVSEESYRRLTEFQCADGGFSTYIASGSTSSWEVSHPDVTPTALRALLTKYSRDSRLIRNGINYVLESASSGLWNSFWWDSFLYSTEANLSLLHETGIRFDTTITKKGLVRTNPRNAFEVALLLLTLSYADAQTWSAHANALMDRLLGEQQSDGSWESKPILRVTKSDCFRPWELQDSSALFPDPHRLFTSSVVLEALSRCQVLFSGRGD
jgi:hypothetical protein